MLATSSYAFCMGAATSVGWMGNGLKRRKLCPKSGSKTATLSRRVILSSPGVAPSPKPHGDATHPSPPACASAPRSTSGDSCPPGLVLQVRVMCVGISRRAPRVVLQIGWVRFPQRTRRTDRCPSGPVLPMEGAVYLKLFPCRLRPLPPQSLLSDAARGLEINGEAPETCPELHAILNASAALFPRYAAAAEAVYALVVNKTPLVTWASGTPGVHLMLPLLQMLHLWSHGTVHNDVQLRNMVCMRLPGALRVRCGTVLAMLPPGLHFSLIDYSEVCSPPSRVELEDSAKADVRAYFTEIIGAAYRTYVPEQCARFSYSDSLWMPFETLVCTLLRQLNTIFTYV